MGGVTPTPEFDEDRIDIIGSNGNEGLHYAGEPNNPGTTYQTNNTPTPVCPHCGEDLKDAWEINFGPGIEGETTVTCPHCGEDYICIREVTIYYSTKPIPLAKETE